MLAKVTFGTHPAAVVDVLTVRAPGSVPLLLEAENSPSTSERLTSVLGNTNIPLCLPSSS